MTNATASKSAKFLAALQAGEELTVYYTVGYDDIL